MQSSTRKTYRFLVILASALTLLCLAQIAFSFCLRQQARHAAEAVDHTYQVIDCLHSLELALCPVGPADHFYGSRSEIAREMARLEYLTRDDRSQRAQLDELIQYTTAPVLRDSSLRAPDASLLPESIVAQMLQTQERRSAREKRASELAMYRTDQSHRFLMAYIAVVIAVLIRLTYSHLRACAQTERMLLETHEALVQDHDSLARVTTFLHSFLNTDLALDNVLARVAACSQELTGAGGAAIEMPEGNHLIGRAATGELAKAIGIKVSLEHSFSGKCLRTGCVAYCSDAETDERVDQDICRQLGVRSMIVVPLRIDSKNVGVLKVSSSMPDAFSEHKAETLELMGSVISTAIDRAGRFAAQAAIQTRLEEELSRVADLNIALEWKQCELENANKILSELATTDGLTGLKNHRAFQESLNSHWANSIDSPAPLSVIMLDVDDFKEYNDQFGHPAGDQVLHTVARIITRSMPEYAFSARYGGEEFAILLPGVEAEGAREIAERCRIEIELAPWERRRITASFGVASGRSFAAPATLLELADQALYRSKMHGKNCVTVCADPFSFSAMQPSQKAA